MGYYTYYGLTILGEDDKVESFKKDLLEQSEDSTGVPDSDLSELLESEYVYAKLYDITDWIDEVAPKHPDILIMLSGDGEDSDDSWETRWRGNDSETQKMIMPPFTNPRLTPENFNNN